MSEPQHISEILRQIAQNPQNEWEETIARLPCMQELLKDPSLGRVKAALLSDWLDNQDVMLTLHISSRTLQTLRSNGALPYSRIGNKIYYRRQDILKILSDNYTMYKIRNHGGNK